jgi:endonuclease I
MMKQFYFNISVARKIILALLVLYFFGSLVTFAQVPVGYYDVASGKTGAELKSSLNGIISGHTSYPYSSTNTDVWDILKAADKDPNNAANVIGIYSGFEMDAAAEYASGAGWNREHVWAKSRGDFGTTMGAGTDCHHIVAADISTNSARNNRNFDYGESFYVDGSGNYSGSTLSKTSSAWVWEPRDEVKGDVARMIFYMATRYEGIGGEPDLELTETLLNNTDKSPIHAKLSVLLQWHQNDPVSTTELNRNEVIYGFQNNRNPFIDHPEYVCEIWPCGAVGNNVPIFSSTGSTTATQGQLYSYNITTSDTEGDTRAITASTKPSWLSSIDNGNGTATLSGTPSSANVGNHSVVLNVSDASGNTNQSFTFVVVSAGGGGSGGAATDLIISEYIEGSSFNKGLEIANYTGSSIDLSNYSLLKQTNGAGNWSSELALSGILADGAVYVVVHTSADAVMKSQADLISGSGPMSFNGNDPIALYKSGIIIDAVGTFGDTSNFGKDVTLVRKVDINSPNTVYSVVEWISNASNTFSFLGSHTMNVGSSETTIPVITLVGNTTINLTEGDTYTDQGATALDNVDGNLTSSIVTTGTVNTALAGTYTVNYNVSDEAGNAATQVSRTVIVAVPVDNTAPIITLVGNATINLIVGDTYNEQGATAIDNLDGNLTTSVITTGTVNTALAGTYTVNYNVSDEAGNAATQVSRTVIVAVPAGCSNGISSFPYSEGFELGIGAWIQSSSDDINWSLDASGTPSSSTGPSSATEGSNYLYIESSGNGTGYPTKTAILNSPCVDLTTESGATLSFSYHMYGSSMGSMILEGSIDGTNWTSLWSKSGNQTNAWFNANVDLTSYIGGTVELRFVGITSTSYRSDMAIDKLNMITGIPPSCEDVTLTLVVDDYPEETSWTINSGGVTVASGAYTGTTPDGSTVIANACLPTGCYTFIINDVYGDGICCSYGNGSYNLRDASNTLLASGGSFNSSQTTNFCVGGASAKSAGRSSISQEIVEEFLPTNIERLYPNPVSDYLFVSTPADVVSIKVITVNGMTMNSVSIANDGIDVSSLESGIYVVLIQTGKGILQERFVKQ